MKRFLTVAVAMLALTGMGQVAMRKLEDLTNTNLVCVTDYGPQVLSLTQRLDATNTLFSAWFSGLQSRTSYWDTAYSWGDHALAGYLLPADLAPYATTQQVAEAVSGAVTNLNLYAVPVVGGKHELWVKE